MREQNGASPHRTRAALHQQSAPLDWTRHMNSPMSSYAGNAQTGTLFDGNGFGQWNRLL